MPLAVVFNAYVMSHRRRRLKMENVIDNSFSVWCYAHFLNLSASDMVENILPAKNFIGLLQQKPFSEFCKRKYDWKKLVQLSYRRSRKYYEYLQTRGLDYLKAFYG